MTIRYICIRCEGEKCTRCTGRGWVSEGLVHIERQNKLAEAVATILVQKKIADQEAWTKKAAEANLTEDQFTEIETWSATGPVKYQLMSLTDEVLDAIASLVGIEMPPVCVADQPELKVVG